MNTDHPRPLDAAAIDAFERRGYARLDAAFPTALADACRAILWSQTGCEPDDPDTWRRPVVRLGMYAGGPFLEAARTPRLGAAFDQLVGPDRWLPVGAMGTFPVRFPSPEDPGDTGWHIDVSFDFEQPDFMAWRANVRSRGRALTLLCLFSDVGPDDAPTRLRVGSHRSIARQLAPAGEAGLTLGELAADGFARTADCEEALATGPAGTVYLCHPFLVHAAQPHRGATPRFMAQPPLLPATPLDPHRGVTPVERAIRAALSEDRLLSP